MAPSAANPNLPITTRTLIFVLPFAFCRTSLLPSRHECQSRAAQPLRRAGRTFVASSASAAVFVGRGFSHDIQHSNDAALAAGTRLFQKSPQKINFKHSWISRDGTAGPVIWPAVEERVTVGFVLGFP